MAQPGLRFTSYVADLPSFCSFPSFLFGSSEEESGTDTFNWFSWNEKYLEIQCASVLLGCLLLLSLVYFINFSFL